MKKKTFANFLRRLTACIDNHCPEESDFTITLIQNRETGQCYHMSSMLPLDEAAGLRELADKLERKAAEMN